MDIRRSLVMAGVLLAAVLASSGAPSSARTPSAARFVAPGGSDQSPCTRRAPCRTFDRAYRLARPGQIIDVRGGHYGDQVIGRDYRKTVGKNVVFRPAASGRVTVDNLEVDGGSHVEFRHMTVSGGWSVKTGSDHVTFRGVSGTNFYITSASNISVIGGSYGPETDEDDAQIRSACMDSSCPHSRNILIAGVSFHDAIVSPGSGAHVECLQVWHTDNITIRRSRFWNCEHHNVFIAGEGDPVTGVTFENDWGTKVRSGYFSFRIAAGSGGEGCSNILYRNNSFTSAIDIGCASASNVRVIGNLGPYDRGACDGRYSYSHNVFQGAACSRTDRRVTDLGFVSSNNLHLRRGSVAINHGDPKSFPTNDIDGQRRPRGRAPDAGADESR
jgi:hypothetical protein